MPGPGSTATPMSDGQLSRQERIALEALEARLRTEDPAFVDKFGQQAGALDRSGGPWSRRLLRWRRRSEG